MKKSITISPIKFYLLHVIPLLCIFARETTKLCFIVELRNLGSGGPLSTAILMFIAIYFSMNLGRRSDKDCRRKMLIITLLGSIAGITTLSFAVNATQHTLTSLLLYLGALGIDGVLGSAGTPIGRAAYFDVWDANNRGYQRKDRLATDTNIASAIPWVLICFNKGFFEHMLIPASLISLSLSLLLVMLVFEDLRDKDSRLVSHEIGLAAKKYLRGYALRLMLAFLLYDLAFQFINYLATEFYKLDELRQDFLLVEGAGIFLGSLVARIGFTYTKRFRSSYKSILIFSLALFSVFLMPWIKGLITGEFAIDNAVRLAFSSVGGVVLALSFGYFSHKVTAHETGLLFGIMEGVEILAEGAISLTFFLGNLKQAASNPHIAAVVMLILIGIGVVLISKSDGEENKVLH